MDRNIIQKVLIGLFLVACLFIGLRTFNVLGVDEGQQVRQDVNTNVSSSRMKIGRAHV